MKVTVQKCINIHFVPTKSPFVDCVLVCVCFLSFFSQFCHRCPGVNGLGCQQTVHAPYIRHSVRVCSPSVADTCAPTRKNGKINNAKKNNGNKMKNKKLVKSRICFDWMSLQSTVVSSRQQWVQFSSVEFTLAILILPFVHGVYDDDDYTFLFVFPDFGICLLCPVSIGS